MNSETVNLALACGLLRDIAKHIATGQISLRDQFAMAALQGLVSSLGANTNFKDLQEALDTYSEASYQFADAMLKIRGKKETPSDEFCIDNTSIFWPCKEGTHGDWSGKKWVECGCKCHTETPNAK